MLIAISTNPTIDRTIFIPTLSPHQVHRSKYLELSAGGKGINVARAAKILGINSRIVGFTGGFAGGLLKKLVAQEELSASWLDFPELETKMSYLLSHSEGDSTVINEPGPCMDREHWQSFADFVLQNSSQARMAILAGGVPPGVCPDSYAALCLALAAKLPGVLVDTHGEFLKAVLLNPQNLMIKVNVDELAEASGCSINGFEEIERISRTLLDRGAKMICTTMGSKGSLAITKDEKIFSQCHCDNFINSVGSGDSFSAGLSLCIMRNLPLQESLRWATACGAANTLTKLPANFKLQDVEKLLKTVKSNKLSIH